MAILTHLTVKVSGVIPATADDVWSVVRIFGDVDRWTLPVAADQSKASQVTTQLLPGSVESQIGALRAVSLGNSSYVEQLECLDEDARTIKWKLISHPMNTNPFPATFLNLKGCLQVMEVTREQAAFMIWTADFDTDLEGADAMREEILKHMNGCFDGLTAFLGPHPPDPPMAGVSLSGPAGGGPAGGGPTGGSDFSHDFHRMDLKPKAAPKSVSEAGDLGDRGSELAGPLKDALSLGDAPGGSFTFPMHAESRSMAAGYQPASADLINLAVLHRRHASDNDAKLREDEERRGSLDSANTSRSSATPSHALHGNVDSALAAYLQMQREQQALEHQAELTRRPVDQTRAFIQQGFNFAAHPQRLPGVAVWPPEAGHLYRRSAESAPRSQGPSPLASPRVSLGSRDSLGRVGDSLGRPAGDSLGRPAGDSLGRPAGENLARPAGDSLARPGT